MEERGISKGASAGCFAFVALGLGLIVAVLWGLSPMGWGFGQGAEREQQRQAFLDKVAQETVAESVRNLLDKDSPFLPSRGLRSLTQSSPADPVELTEELEADPRVAKLLRTIEHGTPAEAEVLHGELLELIDRFLHALPLNHFGGGPDCPTVSSPGSADALPILLAAFSPSVEHLELLVAMADVMNQSHYEMMRYVADRVVPTGSHPGESSDEKRVEPSKIMSTDQSRLLAYQTERILAGLAEQGPGEAAYSEGQRATLDAYTQYREKIRDLSKVYAADAVARKGLDPKYLDELEDLAVLDKCSWRLTEEMVLLGDSLVAGAYRQKECKIIAFARQMCADYSAT